MEGRTLIRRQMGSHVCRNCLTEFRKVLAQGTFQFGQMSDLDEKLLKYTDFLNFMVALCINNIKHFIFQLMHTNYKILRLLK